MSDINQTKEAPHSKESEMIVLGHMIGDSDSLKIGAENLNDSDFYFTQHKTIFAVLKEAHHENKPCDVHIVCEELKRKGKLKSVDGAGYIVTLAQYAGLSDYIEDYCSKLKEKARLRALINVAQKQLKRALNEEDSQKISTETQEELRQIERNSGVKNKFPIKFLNQFDKNFLLVKPPRKPMLLEYNEDKKAIGFLPKGIVAMLVGAGGVGKTHLLAQLAIAISTGTPWLETFTTTGHCEEEKKGNVFFGLGENQYDDIHRVLYKAAKKLREHQPDLTEKDPITEASKRIAAFSFCGQQAVFIEDKNPSMYFRRLKMKLIECAPKGGWDIIILDPVSRLMGADAETDNAAATQFIALLEELTIELPGKPTVLFAHHVSKAAIKSGENQDQTASRGSSALTDGVRWQANFRKGKDSGTAILEVTKSNFTKSRIAFYTKKDEEGFIEKSSKPVGPENKNTKKAKTQEDQKPHWSEK